MKKVVVGSDHAGVRVKNLVVKALDSLGFSVKDFSLLNEPGDDYPDFAELVAKEVVRSKSVGVLVCGSGIGMSIAANKVRGVRAALCRTPRDAVLARQHNDANVLVLSGKTLGKDVGLIVKKFFSSGFEQGRHLRRVKKIKALEKNG